MPAPTSEEVIASNKGGSDSALAGLALSALNQAHGERAAMINEIERLKKQLEAERRKVAVRDEEIRDLSANSGNVSAADLQRANDENVVLNAEVAQLKSENDQLIDNLEGERGERSELQQAFNEVKDVLQQERNSNAKLEVDKRRYKQLLKELKDKKAQIESELKEATRNNDAIKDEIAQSAAVIKSLEKQIHENNERAELAQGRIAELEAISEEKIRIESELAKAKADKDESQSTVARNVELIVSLEAKLDESEKKIASLEVVAEQKLQIESELKEATRNNDAIKDEIAQSAAVIKSLEKQIHENNERAELAQGRIAELEAISEEKIRIESELETIKAAKVKSEDAARESEALIVSLTQKAHNREEELTKLASDIMIELVEEWKSEFQNSALESLEVMYEVFDSSWIMSNKYVSKSKSDAAAFSSRDSQRQRDMDEVTDKKDIALSRVIEVEEELEGVKVEVRKLGRENTSLKSENGSLSRTVADLRAAQMSQTMLGRRESTVLRTPLHTPSLGQAQTSYSAFDAGYQMRGGRNPHLGALGVGTSSVYAWQQSVPLPSSAVQSSRGDDSDVGAPAGSHIRRPSLPSEAPPAPPQSSHADDGIAPSRSMSPGSSVSLRGGDRGNESSRNS